MVNSPTIDNEEACHRGGCQCGAVRYEISGRLEKSHVCHCRMCQRATGGLFAALVGAKKDKVRVTKGAMSFFASSNLASRGFCNQCGTPLSFAYAHENARFYVTIGSLDRPQDAPIEHQFGTESKLPWVTFCEEIGGEVTGTNANGFFDDMVNHQGE